MSAAARTRGRPGSCFFSAPGLPRGRRGQMSWSQVQAGCALPIREKQADCFQHLPSRWGEVMFALYRACLAHRLPRDALGGALPTFPLRPTLQMGKLRSGNGAQVPKVTEPEGGLSETGYPHPGSAGSPLPPRRAVGETHCLPSRLWSGSRLQDVPPGEGVAPSVSGREGQGPVRW